ncbi:Terpenoid synthase [Glarea lozoyensis ATCC 20868]|uniref:Terpenoid synthase n=1 Tax=Glarea lozoyensis (strain ATCC 20868 / MF5171) TaxID=1116229 RepID=S3E9C0_GLAL2|nr:Terpenoid synthase [Glarea lozoyensis ATCC 20868]EPE34883.1 Terpenoid synthase [Glarea lozoyensis ATCC 20868]
MATAPAYERSDSVDPEVVAKTSFTTLPVRVSKIASVHNRYSEEILKEWNEKVGKVIEGTTISDRNGPHSLAVGYPEALEERIKPLVECIELALLHDDIVDTLEPALATLVNGSRFDGSVLYTRTQEMARKTRAKKQLESRNLWDFLNIDRDHGKILIKSWQNYHDTSSGNRAPDSFHNFADWLEYRVIDIAAWPSLELACYGSRINPSQSDRASVEHVMCPLFEVYALTNDFYSFDKEYASYHREGTKNGIPNSVWFLMRDYNISTAEAKTKVIDLILSKEGEYHRKRRELETSGKEISTEAWQYLDHAVFMVSGVSYWSSFCERYQGDPSRAPTSGEEWIVNEHDKQATDTKSETQDRHEKLALDSSQIEERPCLQADVSLETIHLPISEETVMAPYNYLSSLPSKHITAKVIEALNVWYEVPEIQLSIIKNILRLLHSSSLMLDDIEDGSLLRRGKPATHTIFGIAQTINSANYLYTLALEDVAKLCPAATTPFVTELKDLHRGQSMDLYWTHTVSCPTEEEYYRMIDHKTGGFFRLLCKLMDAESEVKLLPKALPSSGCNSELDKEFPMHNLITLIGRFFQIRDDYQNLCSPDYTKQKGFCEDLDEGKYSLPLIHALVQTNIKTQIEKVLLERKQQGSMTLEMKKFVLGEMERCGSLAYTKGVADGLVERIEAEIRGIEGVRGENWILRLFVEMLRL